MDIGAISTALSGIDLRSQVGVQVASIAMDQSQTQAAGVIELMDSVQSQLEISVNPNLGQNVDIKL